MSESAALAIVEEADPAADLEEGWATVLVREAVSYLSTTERRVIEVLLAESEFDFAKNQHEFPSTAAPEVLDMKPAAFRKAKSRAFERLRKLIPEITRDLELDLPTHAEESIFTVSWSGPSYDPEE